MDRAKKSRTPVRTRVTRLCNEVDTELTVQDPEVNKLIDLLEKLELAKERLREEDEKVKEAMLDEDKTEQELDKEDEDVQGYEDKIREIIKKIKVRVPPQNIPAPTGNQQGGDVRGESKAYKLPKIELPKFNGDLKNWLGWWSQFAKIDQDASLHASDKFQYLIQATEEKSEPREIISAFPPTEENYEPAMESLKRRYGREGLQLQVYLRELLNLVIVNVTRKEKISLDKLYLKLESHLRALKTLDLSKAEPSMYFYPLVESSLPDEVLRTWLRSPVVEEPENGGPKKTKLDNLMEFLKREVEGEQQIHLAKNTFQDSKQEKQRKLRNIQEDIPTAASLYNKEKQKGGCSFCNKENHPSHECFKATKMSLEEKRAKVREKRGCYICLKYGHQAGKCKLQIECKLCGKRHYTIMCPEHDKSSKELEKQTEGMQTAVESTSSNYNSHREQLILMKTLQVHVRGRSGKKVNVRLLFDDGSQRSYIKNSIAQEINCEVIGKVRMQNALFGGYMSKEKQSNKFSVTVTGMTGATRKDLSLLGEDVICTSCPTIPNGPWLKKLADQGISLSDAKSSSQEIQMLIGSDLWGELMTGKMIKLGDGLVALESIFGWTLSGKIPVSSCNNLAMTTISMSNLEGKSLTELWKLEVLGIRDTAEKISEEEHELQVKKKLQDNITRDREGRYVVSLPWITNTHDLPTNKLVAEKRLSSATEKLRKQGQYETYERIFKDWEQEGIIQEVTEDDNVAEHFLPHRPVFKPESLTTPVRPVFDASCKVGKHPSLNQCLEKGPNMLELIPSILLRFREKKIGVISDIRKAFQMVGVLEGDRNFQKFLWWKSFEEKTLKVFQHCRVVFGMNCSPFILAAVLDYHLSRVKAEDKKAAEMLSKSLYVDNCVVSVDTHEDYMRFKEQAIRILAEAKMELRQWESNTESSLDKNETLVLGLRWDIAKDTLTCELPKDSKELQITKRNVLSLVSQIYDPIGFTCPAVLQPKMMLQDTWAADLGWDKVWNIQEQEKFRSWYNQLGALEQIKIPRCSRNLHGQNQNVQLHTFCDASQDAYAAVVFLRVSEGTNVSVQLLQAKSRLSPLDKEKKKKRVTINRLELLGCLIGSRLTSSVKKALAMESIPTYMWSDSSNALAWIRRDEDWGTFVGNRVREINRLTKSKEWRHVPGLMNPADLPSRGCSPSHLLVSRWWEGPDWLREPEGTWPNSEEKVDEHVLNGERKKTATAAVSIVQGDLLKFSSFYKNVCVAAWIRRFVTNSRKKKVDRILSKYPTANEMDQGERDLWIHVQRNHFLGKTAVKGMDIEMHEDKLLHVKTRLLYKEDTELFRCPILLPKDDPLVHQMIRYVHVTNCHAGTQFVLGKIREKYWIPSGRKTVGRIIRKCVTCKRYSSKGQPCESAPLPQARVETQCAFQTTGVDLAGPILLKGKKKVWIVLYTDAVYRGVYLDVVDSISSDEFLDSLEKFTYAVGRPSRIYSDNGTNFVGAQNLMKALDWKKLEEKLHIKQIRWTFNPPAAAWWGGWWERLVRSIKELLRRMLGTAKLTRKELEKCLTAVAFTINDRPLTTLTEDGEDLIPLTPSMFMKDLPVSGLPERDYVTGRDLEDSYRKIQNLKKALQERFRKEYLANIVQRKNEMKSHPLAVGDVVLVGADNKKRYEWPLGKVLELIPGSDGKIRVAKVKTSSGVLTRPLQRLYPLEVTSSRSIAVPVKGGKENKGNIPSPQREEPYKTRRGREVKKPTRYGQWNNN